MILKEEAAQIIEKVDGKLFRASDRMIFGLAFFNHDTIVDRIAAARDEHHAELPIISRFDHHREGIVMFYV
jgi:hypothetical protein